MIIGCDIGTSVTKAVAMYQGVVKHKVSVATNVNPEGALKQVCKDIYQETGTTAADLRQLAVTGWGQQKITTEHVNANHMNCLAKAAVWSEPQTRSVLNLGSQQGVALSIGPNSRLLEYRASNKCANGAGEFLAVITEALGCSVAETAGIAGQSTQRLNMSSQCAVFAESEVVSLVNDGEPVADIIEAILNSLVKNVVTLCKRIKVKDTFIVGGGLMNNTRILEILAESIKATPIPFAEGPDYIAAVGAALIGGSKS
jgi:predicted CoA-substrate-specific enzyme activase